HSTHLLDRLGRLVARALRLGDRLARALLLRAEALQLGEQLTAAGVEPQDLVDRAAGSPTLERSAHALGILSNELEVEHAALPAAAARARPHGRARRGGPGCAPGGPPRAPVCPAGRRHAVSARTHVRSPSARPASRG